MQKLCCVRTRQHHLPFWFHNLSLTNLLISPSILNHFRWELYQFTTPRLGVTRFYQCLRLCSCGTKPQRSENHHFVMMSSWEPQCHHAIIMRTPRITGKPKFSCSGGLYIKYPFFELGIKHRPQIYLAQTLSCPTTHPK